MSPKVHPLEPRVVPDGRDAAAPDHRLAADLFQVAGGIGWRGDTLSYLRDVIQWGSATAWGQTLYLTRLSDSDGYWCWLASRNAGASDGSPLPNATPVARDTERSGTCAPPPPALASPARVLNGTVTKYYYFGAQRVAMRTASGVTYLHGDHLGSTSVTADSSGTETARQTYYAYGTVRTISGTLPTDYTFTGQKLDASSSLMYYGARYYDAAIGRFAQPDSLVPNPYNPQYLNRYTYTLNNPVKYVDPSGHAACIDEECDLLQNPTNHDVIVANADNPLYAMILEISQGRGTAADALQRILSQTSDTPLFTHFRGLGAIRGDAGFQREFADDHLYGELWAKKQPYSMQLGHFLTAVDMGFNGDDFLKRAVVGHEQIPDTEGFRGNARAPLKPSRSDMQAFDWAIVYDAQGNPQARDEKLGSIFDPAMHGAQANREGNSMEDLRLSVRGWILGRDVALSAIVTNRELANWIALNVAGD